MIRKYVISIVISLSVIIIPSMGEPIDKTVLKFPPRDIYGWKISGKPEVYNRETLYDYMDGAAEIYLAYDFQGLLVQRYLKPRNPEIVVEIFDMGSLENAFGIFSHGQGRSKETGIGQGSEYRGGLLCFWKDRSFICIRAERETPSTRRAVLSIGEFISKAIKSRGEKPRLLNYLPEKDLIEKSIRYFHRHVILNYHYYVSDENILKLNEYTRVVLARYNDDSHLLLIQYLDPEQARFAFDSFITAYMPEAKQTGIIQTEDGKWTVATMKQDFVVIVFDALTKKIAISRIEAVINKLS